MGERGSGPSEPVRNTKRCHQVSVSRTILLHFYSFWVIHFGLLFVFCFFDLLKAFLGEWVIFACFHQRTI